MSILKTLVLAAFIALPVSTAQAQQVAIPANVLQQIQPGVSLTSLAGRTGFSVAQLQQAAAQLGFPITTSAAGTVLVNVAGGGGLLGGLGIGGGLVISSAVIAGLLAANSTSGTN